EEGSNWEALMTAAKQELGNLVVIVDRNHLQQGATTEETTGLASVSDKLAAFGCEVRHVDGHDYLQLLAALGGDSTDRRQPLAVVAHTVKGHPVSFMSNNVSWHHRVPSSDEVRIALAELEGR
ncbi:MAG: transketolase, partial [Propionicimonas sp.]|nr:transketolase [Propionicimonas sp.]